MSSADDFNRRLGNLLRESWGEYGELRCQGCDFNPDVSDLTFDETVDLWNDHVRERHGGGRNLTEVDEP